MYVDDSVVFGLVVVAVTLVFMGYWGVFAYRHIKEDIAQHDG